MTATRRFGGPGTGPAGPGLDRAKARRAALGLLEASRGVTLGGLRIKDLLSEGRSGALSLTTL
jgi:hypothetical protein